MFQRIAWLTTGLVMFLMPPAMAGDGSIEGDKVNISVMFTYREDNPTAWKPLFDEASQLLYNATNGQLQLGRVRVVNCGFDLDLMDVWVLNNEMGALANMFGLGGIGHIYLSQVHRSTTGGALGQFGLVHEFGHYAFGVYDEYKGTTESARFGAPAEQTGARAPNQFCVTDDDANACLMDGGTTILPNNGRTEFCTHTEGGLSTAHNDGIVVGDLRFLNYQQGLNGESCWETMARTVGLAPPVEVDTEDPPGLEPIIWELANNLDRVVICFDRSGSMGGEFALAQFGARSTIDFLHAEKTITGDDGGTFTVPGEEFAIVSFADEASVDFPIQEILDETAKDAAREALENLTVAGGTNIGAALEAGLDQISSLSETPSCSEAIILLSDGLHSVGLDPEEVLPDLEARGVRVYAVGLGLGANLEELQTIASATRGQFYVVNSEDEVIDAFAQIAASIRSGGIVFNESGEIGGENQTTTILIDNFGEEVTTILDWEDGTLDLTLISPSGDEITVQSADSRPEIEAVRRENFLYIRIVDPETGTWTGVIRPIFVEGTTGYELTVIEESRSAGLFLSTDRDLYDVPQQVHLRADLIAEVPVAGAELTAKVDRPGGGPPVDIELFDDGSPDHGDTFADDGVYSAIFDDYTDDGVYTFRVTAVNIDGTGPDPQLPFVEDGDGGPPIQIPPFVRDAEIAVLVRGVTEGMPGELEFHPTTFNLGAGGQNVACYLELPKPYDATNIDVATVRFMGIVPAELHPTTVGDVDEDGVPDRMVKFDRQAVGELLSVGGPEGVGVYVEVNGNLETGELFNVEDVINVIDPGGVVGTDADTVATGQTLTLTWDPVPGAGAVTYGGFVSLDAMNFREIFSGLVDVTEYAWDVDVPSAEGVRVLIEARDIEGVARISLSSPFDVIEGTVGVGDAPLRTVILGLHPNPTTGGTAIQYSLENPETVRLEIFDVAGRQVRRLVEDTQSPGVYEVHWDGRDTTGRSVSSGVYWYVFEAGSYRNTGRVMMLR